MRTESSSIVSSARAEIGSALLEKRDMGNQARHQLVDALFVMEHTVGPAAFLLLSQVAQGNMSPQDMIEKMDTVPHLDEFQHRALEILEEYGYVEHIDGALVVDDAFLFASDSFSIKDLRKEICTHKRGGYKTSDFDYFSKGSRLNFFYYAFYGKDVILRRDYNQFQQGTISKEALQKRSKPLFYSPESVAAAFDPEKIKQADFHMGLWEASSRIYIDEYPSVTVSNPNKPGHGLPLDDVALACVIFHPKYGNGKRTRDGLEVRMRHGERQMISTAFFDQYYKGGGAENMGTSPQSLLQDRAYPFLSEYGVLHPDDFGVSGGGSGDVAFETEKDISQKDGMIMYRGVRYTLGKEFADKRHTFVVLDEHTGGIACYGAGGKKVLVARFSLVERLKESTTETYRQVGKKEINIQLLSDEEQQTIDIDGIRHTVLFLFREHDIVPQSMNFDMRQHVHEAIGSLVQSSEDKKQLHDFINTFGLVGLSVVASLHDHGVTIDSINSIVDKCSTRADAIALLRRCTELVHETDVTSLRDASIQTVYTHEVRRRIAQALHSFEDSTKQLTYRDIDAELKHVHAQAMELASWYKSMRPIHPDISPEAFDGVERLSVRGDTVSKEEQNAMVRMAARNNMVSGHVRPFAEKVILPALQSNFTADNTFYELKKDGVLVGFFRMRQQKDSTYFGSFNITPEAQAAGLGDVFLRSALPEYEGKGPIRANVEVDSSMAATYINGMHFVATRVLRNVEHGGVDGFDIMRDSTLPIESGKYISVEGDLDDPSSRDHALQMVETHLQDMHVVIRVTKEQGITRFTLARVKQAEEMARQNAKEH